ncbi:MAG: SO_0444 family Cu/Zn efflux transporter [Bacteroidales bacterium]|nr:SO_0444 family Cu/Zn efflux transporter [Bacteroidales bacterium]
MQEIIHLINEMSPYLLLGFLFAGLLHSFVPSKLYNKYLSKPTFGSVVNAALLGIPLPLCSCGVIPTAMSLRKEGASKGATTSFLIATPQTGVDSILATYGMMGLPFAIVRPVAALCTALFGGAAANIFGKADKSDSSGKSDLSDCAHHDHCLDDQCECGCGGHSHSRHRNKLVEALHYAYVDMIADIGKWLLIGLFVAGLITVLIPDNAFTIFQGNTLASMLLVLCIAVPMYLCATGSIPIAVALMLKGLTPGAALVLLMAGPACNFASMLVVKKVLGTRSLIIYLASIVIGAVGFGYLIDFLHFGGYVNFLGSLQVAGVADSCCTPHDSWFAWLCTTALLLLVLNALVLPKLRRHKKQEENKTTENMNVRIYHIEGMNCNHCRTAAEKALQGVEGVTSARVVLETKEAIIEGTASEEELRKAVESVGFSLTN